MAAPAVQRFRASLVTRPLRGRWVSQGPLQLGPRRDPACANEHLAYLLVGVGHVAPPPFDTPDDVGVQVEVEGGLSSISVSGLDRRGDVYVNDAFGEVETELLIQVTTGVGALSLIEVSNGD